MGQAAHDRLRAGHRPALFTDALASDEAARLEVFGRRSPAQGRGRHPVMRWRQGLAEGQGKKADKDGRVEGVAVRVVHGKARLAHGLSRRGDKPINTSVVERHNGTESSPEAAGSPQDLGLVYSQALSRLDALAVGGPRQVLSASQQCENQSGGPGSPSQSAMAAGVTAHLWSTREWLLRPVLGGQR